MEEQSASSICTESNGDRREKFHAISMPRLEKCNGKTRAEKVLVSSARGDKAKLINALEDNAQQYAQSMLALKSFRSKSKQKVNNRSHITDWQEEQLQLVQLIDRLDHQRTAQIREMLLHGGLDLGVVQQLLDDEAHMNDERSKMKSGYKNQIKELSRFLKDQTLSSQSKATVDSHHQTEGESSDNKKNSLLIAAVCADVFVRYRGGHSEVWKRLKDEETELKTAISAHASRMARMLKEDIILDQDESVRSEIFSHLRGLQLSQGDHSADGDKSSFFQGEDPDIVDLIGKLTTDLQEVDSKARLLQQEKSTEYQQLCVEIGLDVSLSPDSIAFGGWNIDDHETFAKVYRQAEVKGILRKKMMDSLQLQLPHIPRDEVLLHEEWFRKARLVQKKFRDAEAACTVRRQDLIDGCKAAIKLLLEERQKRLEQERLLQLQEENRLIVHEQLERMRAEREMREHDLLLRQAELDDMERRRQEEEFLLQQAEREKKKQLLEEYKQEKARIEAERQREQDEAAERATEQMRQLIEQNRSRLELRAQMIEEKQQIKKRKEEEMLEKEQRRIEFLNQLAEQVPYFDAIQAAQSKLDYVTASAKGQEYIKPEELSRGHIPLYSFANHTIIRDARFRLAEALRGANVHNTPAGRAAVLQFHPRPHLAIHGII